MATSTLGASPGVRMSWSEMWTWKADTPARVPAGARISAGKSGKVDMSLPEQGAGGGEAVAGELHAVAGVPGETDHHPVELLRSGSVSRVVTASFLVSLLGRLAGLPRRASGPKTGCRAECHVTRSLRAYRCGPRSGLTHRMGGPGWAAGAGPAAVRRW